MRSIACIRGPIRGYVWSTLLFGAAVAQAEEDIHDIRAPKAVPGPGSWMLPAVLAGAIVIALCAYALWRRRRRQAHRSLTLPEQALKELEKARPLMRPATAREFGIAVSEVIRRFIEKRFDVVATQRTTEEFLQALLQGPDDTLTRHRPLLQDILQQCDLVKFAGTSLAVSDMESLLASAHSFVVQSGEPPVR